MDIEMFHLVGEIKYEQISQISNLLSQMFWHQRILILCQNRDVR